MGSTLLSPTSTPATSPRGVHVTPSYRESRLSRGATTLASSASGPTAGLRAVPLVLASTVGSRQPAVPPLRQAPPTLRTERPAKNDCHPVPRGAVLPGCGRRLDCAPVGWRARPHPSEVALLSKSPLRTGGLRNRSASPPRARWFGGNLRGTYLPPLRHPA